MRPELCNLRGGWGGRADSEAGFFFLIEEVTRFYVDVKDPGEREREPCRRGGGELSNSFLGDFTLVGTLALDRSVPTVTEEKSVSGQEAGDWFKEEADGVKSLSMSQ